MSESIDAARLLAASATVEAVYNSEKQKHGKKMLYALRGKLKETLAKYDVQCVLHHLTSDDEEKLKFLVEHEKHAKGLEIVEADLRALGESLDDDDSCPCGENHESHTEVHVHAIDARTLLRKLFDL